MCNRRRNGRMHLPAWDMSFLAARIRIVLCVSRGIVINVLLLFLCLASAYVRNVETSVDYRDMKYTTLPCCAMPRHQEFPGCQGSVDGVDLIEVTEAGSRRHLVGPPATVSDGMHRCPDNATG